MIEKNQRENDIIPQLPAVFDLIVNFTSFILSSFPIFLPIKWTFNGENLAFFPFTKVYWHFSVNT
jgi:hypothetical protein